jgi:hypothetical protein
MKKKLLDVGRGFGRPGLGLGSFETFKPGPAEAAKTVLVKRCCSSTLVPYNNRDRRDK